MNIKVLGSGCSSCHKLYEETLKAVKEMEKDYTVEYVTDIQVMLGYGIMTAPALLVDEKIVYQGRSLKAKDIIKLLNGLKIEDSSNGNSCCSCGGNC